MLVSCCAKKQCWSFATKGLSFVGQDEILIVCERLPDENIIPRDFFRVLSTVYESASRGAIYTDFSHCYFSDGLFGNKDINAILFIRSTLQCFNKLPLPSPPFLVAILIHKMEIPWIRIFPLRLILRLGAEYKCMFNLMQNGHLLIDFLSVDYPCPIVNQRFRKPTYFEIGHTIMNVLAVSMLKSKHIEIDYAFYFLQI